MKIEVEEKLSLCVKILRIKEHASPDFNSKEDLATFSPVCLFKVMHRQQQTLLFTHNVRYYGTNARKEPTHY